MSKHNIRLGVLRGEEKTKDSLHRSNVENNEQQLNLIATLKIFTTTRMGTRSMMHEKTFTINESENIWWDEASKYPFYIEKSHRYYQGILTKIFSHTIH